MGEGVQKHVGASESVRFIPSHLTKGLVASAASLALGVYALWEFAHVEKDEVISMLRG